MKQINKTLILSFGSVVTVLVVISAAVFFNKSAKPENNPETFTGILVDSMFVYTKDLPDISFITVISNKNTEYTGLNKASTDTLIHQGITVTYDGSIALISPPFVDAVKIEPYDADDEEVLEAIAAYEESHYFPVN